MAKEIIKQFNDILGSFLTQVTPLIGPSYYKKFDLISKLNASLFIEQFLVHALPLREKIVNKDESYFLNNDFNDKINGDDDLLGEIFKIKDIYLKLDDNSKNNLWDITQAMLHLGEEYVRLNYKTT